MITRIKTIITVIAVAMFTVACSSSTDTPTAATTSNLEVNISTLPNLGTSHMYVGWIIGGTKDKPTRENVGVIGTSNAVTLKVDAAKLKAAVRFAVSIQTDATKADKEPSSTIVLIGDFSSNIATLSSTSAIANFSKDTVTGKYVLAVPSKADSETATFDNGIWFLDNTGSNAATPVAGLSGLPSLASGWKYEGWIVFEGKTPISTGTFSSGTGADSDGAGPNKGSKTTGIPAFPGQDFISATPTPPQSLTYPKSLKGATVVISVEPNPDNDAAPFQLKPLKHTIPAEATAGTLHTMTKSTTATELGLNGTATRQ